MAYRSARSDQEALIGSAGASSEAWRDLADTINRIGLLMGKEGRISEAEIDIRSALRIREKLSHEHPTDSEFRRRMAESYHNLSLVTQNSTGKEAEIRKALAAMQKLVDDNAGVTIFNSRLAHTHDTLGLLLAWNGKAVEALDSFGQEEAMLKTLVEAHPFAPDFREFMANCENNMAPVFLRLGRTAEARSRCERAVALGEVLIRDFPTVRDYRRRLAESLFRFGQVRRSEGDSNGATADCRRALALWESLSNLEGEDVFNSAACQSLLSSLAEHSSAGLAAAQGNAAADRAIAFVARAIAMGYRFPSMWRTETALDPLRSHPDFKLLMMDLAMPTEPFAP